MSQSLELEYIIKVALAETMRALEIEFGWVYLLEGGQETGYGHCEISRVRNAIIAVYSFPKIVEALAVPRGAQA